MKIVPKVIFKYRMFVIYDFYIQKKYYFIFLKKKEMNV